MEGQTISHYRILSEVGRGGMGIVYKAEDMRLHRPVALKFLSQELTRDADAKQRFVREARAASALDHPNICTIHDIDESADGRLFLGMAYYQGEALNHRLVRGKLDPASAIDIAIQVARGLAKAHEAGIVHRDIKPANLFITHEGLVKILDFGVAKLVGKPGLTRSDAVLGTLAYMAPEQRHGQEADQRSDLWALGIVLYEMLTGELPFPDVPTPGAPSWGSETLKAVRLAAPSVPSGLDQVVSRALQQNPRNRYASADELCKDLEACRAKLIPAHPVRRRRHLRLQAAFVLLAAAVAGIYWWTRNGVVQTPSEVTTPRTQRSVTGATPQPQAPAETEAAGNSLAVLPFVNVSSDPEQEYFADGITEELLNHLVRLKALRVTARTSTFALKGSEESVQSIAEKLGVRHILEGSVRKAGDEVRITAQLISALDGFTLWSNSYSRRLDDIFTIQEDIARSVAEALQVTLGLREGGRMLGGTTNVRAYDLYLSARALLTGVNRGGLDRESVAKSLEQIRQAIALDDKFALAWVLKSNAHDEAQIYFPEQVDHHRREAEQAAQRAFELEPKLPQAHLELAFKAVTRLEWMKAEDEFAEARTLGLSDDELGQYAYLLVNAGHIRRARDLFLSSHASDPLNATIFMYLTVTNDILGDTRTALDFYDRGKALFQNWPAGDFNALVTVWGRGDDKRGREIAAAIPGPIFEAVNRNYAAPESVVAELRKLYAGGAHSDPISLISIAAAAAHFGDPELALTALIDTVDAVPLNAHKFWQPLFAEVRKLDAFKAYLRDRGFVDYWQRHGWPDSCEGFDPGDFECN
jgi:serine/threonine-protein kinase